MNYEHELRLAWAIAMNALVILTVGRAAWRASVDPALRVCDTLLGWWLFQYLAVGLCGISGLLTPAWLAIVSTGLCVGLMLAGRRTSGGPLVVEWSRAERLTFRAAAVSVAAYGLAAVWDARFLPAMGDDPLTYHLPAAAAWLQRGRIDVFETWFFNPANSYSPLAGSMFAVWMIAPFDSDVAARFMQAPAVLAIFAATTAIARHLGAGALLACMLGIAAALCRPVITQALLAKDDLFLCAFVLTALVNFARTDRLATLRFAISIGLAASTKFTSVYALLVLLPLVRIPKSPAGWRNLLMGAIVVAVVAGPWFVRNLLLTQNPVFPIRLPGLDGLFATEVSPRLRSIDGLRQSLIDGYFSLGRVMTAALIGVWVTSIAIAVRRRWFRSTLTTAVFIGPVLCIGAFVLTSPYAEARFVISGVVVMIASIATWAVVLPRTALAIGTMTAIIAVSSGFESSWTMRFAAIGALATAAWVTLDRLWQRRSRRQYLVAGALVVLIGGVWVYWNAYVVSLVESSHVAWASRYGPLVEAWRFVRHDLPRGAPLAYTNTYLIYPLMGERLDRPVLHVPVAPGVHRLHDLPPFQGRINETTLLPVVVGATQANGDAVQWRRRVLDSSVAYLIIARTPIAPQIPPAPELGWVAGDNAFRPVFDNPAATIFEVVRASSTQHD